MSGRRVVVAGGSGFIGSRIIEALLKKGYAPVVLTRSPDSDRGDGVREAHWDGKTVGDWIAEIDGAHAIVNLAGSTVDTRHTPENKKRIINSRVDSTSVLGEAASQVQRTPTVWLQASAVGFYGDAGDARCTESSPPGSDFLADVVQRWEAAFKGALPDATRGVAMRIGFVLDAEEGALSTLAGLARWGLGGAAGSGDQFISWVHIDDVVAAFLWALENPDARDSYNLSAPEPSRNRDFMKTLRDVLNRPWSPPVPSFAVRLGGSVLGTAPELALHGQRCIPERLQAAGFNFEFPELPPALRNLLNPGS